MKRMQRFSLWLAVLVGAIGFAFMQPLLAQQPVADSLRGPVLQLDSLARSPQAQRAQNPLTDTLATKRKRDRKKDEVPKWLPNPKRSVMLSLVAPGAGQIYNRSYWKAPIVWGLLGGSAYFLADNHLKTLEWGRIYRSLADEDPGNNLRSGISARGARLTRDFYRRNRDVAMVALIASYALQGIEAFVDAHLKGFTVSDKLSVRMKIKPAMPIQTARLIGGPYTNRLPDLSRAPSVGMELPNTQFFNRLPPLQVFAGMRVELIW
jgi:hypothetical protein